MHEMLTGASPGQTIWGGQMASAQSPISRGLGAEPPAGSRSRAPCQGSGGESPWSWKPFRF